MSTIENVRTRRMAVLQDLASLEAFRRGSVVEHYVPQKRRDGSVVRYGPYAIYSMKDKDQKTVSRHLKGADEAERYRRQTQAFRRFQELVRELVLLGEQLCELQEGGEASDALAKKGASQKAKKRRK